MKESAVCILINKLDHPTLTVLGLEHNKRLTSMLELAPSISQSLPLGEVPDERRQLHSQAFCDLLGCCRTKLRFAANVGSLMMLCPTCTKAGEMCGVICPRLPVPSIIMVIGVAKLQLSCSYVKSVLQRITNGSGSCNQTTSRKSRELSKKCSKLPGVAMIKCIPVEKRRFLD